MLEKRRLARSGTSRLLAVLVGFSLILGARLRRHRRPPVSLPHRRPPFLRRPRRRRSPRSRLTSVPWAPTAASSSGGSSASARRASRSSSRREAEFVNAFNASQKDVYLALEIYNNNVAANILKTQIAAGNAPDIIGPVGVEGLNLFRDQLLDLQPLIDENDYSVEGVPQELVDFFKLGENNATIGVPFAVYPSFLYFNKDLFDEAGLGTRRRRSATSTTCRTGTWTPCERWP